MHAYMYTHNLMAQIFFYVLLKVICEALLLGYLYAFFPTLVNKGFFFVHKEFFFICSATCTCIKVMDIYMYMDLHVYYTCMLLYYMYIYVSSTLYVFISVVLPLMACHCLNFLCQIQEARGQSGLQHSHGHTPATALLQDTADQQRPVRTISSPSTPHTQDFLCYNASEFWRAYLRPLHV